MATVRAADMLDRPAISNKPGKGRNNIIPITPYFLLKLLVQ
jgi:hypothetical protein